MIVNKLYNKKGLLINEAAKDDIVYVDNKVNLNKIDNVNKTIDKINVVINTVTNHLILEFFSLLNFELVTLLFSATLFFELLFALLVEIS